jgi:hypothetical protein
MTEELGLSRQAKAAQTKLARTRERILFALEELLNEKSASKITLSAICERAGCSTDPLNTKQHEGLRREIDARLLERITEESKNTSANKKRRSLTITAELKIEQLEAELAEVKTRYKASQQALNVLAQVVHKLAPKQAELGAVLHLLEGRNSE